MTNLMTFLTLVLGFSSAAHASTCTISFNLEFSPGSGLSAVHPVVTSAVDALLSETGCIRTDNQVSDYRVQLGYYEQSEGFFKAAGPQFFYVAVTNKSQSQIYSKRSRFVKLEPRDFDKRGERFLTEKLSDAAEKIGQDLSSTQSE